MKQLWELYGHNKSQCLAIIFVFCLYFPIQLFSLHFRSQDMLFGMATLMSFECRWKTTYKRNKIWSYISRQWGQGTLHSCLRRCFGTATAACGGAWAAICHLSALPISSGSRQITGTELQRVPHLRGAQDFGVHIPAGKTKLKRINSDVVF